MGFWITLGLWIASTVIGLFFSPRPPRQRRQAAAPMEVPMAEEDRPVPVVLGTMIVRNPNVLWWGDVVALANANTISGYQYYMGAHLGICVAGEKDANSEFGVMDILFNDLSVGRASTTTVAPESITFDDLNVAPFVTGYVPPATFYSHNDLAHQVQVAMDTAWVSGGGAAGHWRVVYGFQIEPGMNDLFAFRTTFGGVTTNRFVTIPTSELTDYDPQELASTLQDLLNAQQATIGGGPDGSFLVEWLTVSLKFRITFTPIRAGFTAFELAPATGAGLDAGINALMGFRFDAYLPGVGSPSVLLSDFTRHPRRFGFVMKSGGGGYVKLVGTSLASLLGVNADVSMPSDAQLDVMWQGGEPMPDPNSAFDAADVSHVWIDQPDLFGTEGGVVGKVTVYNKPDAMPASWYLKTKVGVTLPRYKKLCYAVLEHPLVGYTSYPKPVSFVVRAIPNSFATYFPGARIGLDINPALAIYAALVDEVWGRGLPESLLDISSFTAAAATLASEQFGISAKLDDPNDVKQLIEEILRHIDGVLYQDVTTGLLGIALARDDYDPTTIPELGDDQIKSCTFRRPSWSETRNIVKVRYLDRASGYTEKVEQAHDLANIAARGGEQVFEEISFPMVTTQANAKVVANRALRALSRPLATLELEVDRTAWALKPGDVFAFTFKDLGITRMPCRVTRVNGGTPSDGRILFDAVEDAFGAAWTDWTEPTT